MKKDGNTEVTIHKIKVHIEFGVFGDNSDKRCSHK